MIRSLEETGWIGGRKGLCIGKQAWSSLYGDFAEELFKKGELYWVLVGTKGAVV